MFIVLGGSKIKIKIIKGMGNVMNFLFRLVFYIMNFLFSLVFFKWCFYLVLGLLLGLKSFFGVEEKGLDGKGFFIKLKFRLCRD